MERENFRNENSRTNQKLQEVISVRAILQLAGVAGGV